MPVATKQGHVHSLPDNIARFAGEPAMAMLYRAAAPAEVRRNLTRHQMV